MLFNILSPMSVLHPSSHVDNLPCLLDDFFFSSSEAGLLMTTEPCSRSR